MGSEPQGWTGELSPILRFLPCQPRCFLHFLELLSKLRNGGQEQTVNKLPAPSPRGSHHISSTQCQLCRFGRNFRTECIPSSHELEEWEEGLENDAQ